MHKWWDIYADDIRWAPPYYPTMRREMEPATNEHLARMQPLFAYIEAYPTSRQPTHQRIQSGDALARAPLGVPSTTLTPQPLATAAVLTDPRRDDSTGYLAMLHCENSSDALERFLWSLAEDLYPRGCRRLVGPVDLSPHLHAGALQGHWGQFPPIHTPYNPPYLPELLDAVLRPTEYTSRLYSVPVSDSIANAGGPADIVPLEPQRLANDFLPLFQEACRAQSSVERPPPDTAEVQFLLRRLRPWPLTGWLARIAGEPAGFVLQQPDYAPALHRANGGRNLVWRLWLRGWAAHRPTVAGRVLFGAVAPAVRRQGVGTQLLFQALDHARDSGWTTLTVGAIGDANTAATEFLTQHGAEPAQTYTLYEWHV